MPLPRKCNRERLRAGFRKIVLRGDTAFTQTIHLDRWNGSGVKFLFGMKAYGGPVDITENVATKDWKQLPRSPKYDPETPDRACLENVKEQIIAVTRTSAWPPNG